MPLTFGQRKGLKQVKTAIQIDGMDLALRNALWNVLQIHVWTTPLVADRRDTGVGEIRRFAQLFWHVVLHAPIDTVPYRADDIMGSIRNYFFNCEWYEVYEFLEFTLGYFRNGKFLNYNRLVKSVNSVLVEELSAYRFVDTVFTDITSPEELEMLEQVLADSQFAGVQTHLKRALELYSDRKQPDYRTSIKESVSAVESLARIITNDPKATLGDALRRVEISTRIHPALKAGFSKLYGYASDEEGIRHAMLEETNLDAADARYFLVSCSAFINYLKGKLEPPPNDS